MIRQPAVAGHFYPDDPDELSCTLADLFKACPCSDTNEKQVPKALIVPHAALHFSGQVAASAFCAIRSKDHPIERVILIGPSHHKTIAKPVVSSATHFMTPLGAIGVDHDSVFDLMAMGLVEVDDSAHLKEHCLEVQLPFLQLCLTSFMIIPVLVGAHHINEVVELCQQFSDQQSLLVISSDMSHFIDHQSSSSIGANSGQKIVAKQLFNNNNQASGATAINGFLRYADAQQLQFEQQGHNRLEGTTDDSYPSLVGYASFIAR